MLPNTPLHHLIMRELQRPVVCTSGNFSEEPMCIEFDEAKERLSGIADAFLTHDRPIVRQVDDSVVRIGPDGPRLLRRARGYAPMAIELGSDGPPILAVGGHLKNTVALRIGSQVVLSQHVGDLDRAEARTLFARTITDLLTFHGVTPALVACDAHPDYASTQYAVQYAATAGIRLLRVQHHHAHALSVMAEHRLEGRVLGLTWDGSGFGDDGTVWGGEALLCDANEFRRVAHLRPFRLPGGDQEVREPRRAALGLLHEMMGDSAMDLAERWFSPTERRVLSTALRRGVLCPVTTSMGRFFDAVACLAGLCARCLSE
jgi:hydrogenase maturation protein HypF